MKLKLNFVRLWSFLVIVLALASCAKRGGVTTSTIEVSVGHGATNLLNYEVILIGKNLKSTQKFLKVFKNASVKLEIPNGEWEIEGMAWDKSAATFGMQGKVYCGKSVTTLLGQDKNLDLVLTNSLCRDLYPNDVNLDSQGVYLFQRPSIFSCKHFDYSANIIINQEKCARNWGSTDNRSGYGKSYHLEIMDQDNFGGLGVEGEVLTSACQDSSGFKISNDLYANKVSASSLNIPKAMYQSSFVKIKNFYSGSCDLSKNFESFNSSDARRLRIENGDIFIVHNDKHLCEDARGKNATSFPAGDGSLSSPFAICSLDQFKKINENVGSLEKTYELASDIDYNFSPFTPIGILNGTPTAFTGNLNGNNHSIEKIVYVNNVRDYVGLFAQVKPEANQDQFFQNIVLKKSYFAGQNYVGAFAGQVVLNATTSFKTKFENNKVHSGVKGQLSVGGLIGLSSHSYVYISKNYVQNSVEAKEFAGGLVGKIDYDLANYTISLNALFTKVNVSNTYAGGMVGYTFQNNGQLDFNNNYIRVRSLNGEHVGGFLGKDYNLKSKFDDNKIVLVLDNVKGRIGGFVGYVDQSFTVTDNKFKNNIVMIKNKSTLNINAFSYNESGSAGKNVVYIDGNNASPGLITSLAGLTLSQTYSNKNFNNVIWDYSSSGVPSQIHFNNGNVDIFRKQCGTGDGSFENPKIICHSSELLQGMIPGNYYKLGSNIDINSTSSSISDGKYYLDGNGYTIFTNSANSPLFNKLNAGSIITNMEIAVVVSGLPSTNEWAVLAKENFGHIHKVKVVTNTSSQVTSAPSSHHRLGGLVYINSGKIDMSSVDIDLNINYTAINDLHLGILAYENTSIGEIFGSKVDGSIRVNSTDKIQAGGLVYKNSGKLFEVSNSIVFENNSPIVNSSVMYPFIYEATSSSSKMEDAEFLGSLIFNQTVVKTIDLLPPQGTYSRVLSDTENSSTATINIQNGASAFINNSYLYVMNNSLLDVNSAPGTPVQGLSSMSLWNVFQGEFTENAFYKWTITEESGSDPGYFTKLRLLKPNKSYDEFGPGF